MPSGREHSPTGTVVTGTIGDDVHVIGIRIMEYALRTAGYEVVALGVLVAPEQFIDAAKESAADAIFISSLNGHVAAPLADFRAACVESGIGDILIYLGGQLTIRQPDWGDVEDLFLNQLRIDRIYPPSASPDDALRDLARDIASRSGRTADKEGPND